MNEENGFFATVFYVLTVAVLNAFYYCVLFGILGGMAYVLLYVTGNIASWGTFKARLDGLYQGLTEQDPQEVPYEQRPVEPGPPPYSDIPAHASERGVERPAAPVAPGVTKR